MFSQLMRQPLVVLKVKQQVAPAVISHRAQNTSSSGGGAVFNPFVNPQALNNQQTKASSGAAGGSNIASSSAASSGLKLSLSVNNMKSGASDSSSVVSGTSSGVAEKKAFKFVFK